MTCSALEGHGIDEVLGQSNALFSQLEASGALATQRSQQDVDAMHRALGELFRAQLQLDHGEQLADLESKVRAGTLSPYRAAQALLGAD